MSFTSMIVLFSQNTDLGLLDLGYGVSVVSKYLQNNSAAKLRLFSFCCRKKINYCAVCVTDCLYIGYAYIRYTVNIDRSKKVTEKQRLRSTNSNNEFSYNRQ